jgi:choline dehydrogenase-like flavoprotein
VSADELYDAVVVGAGVAGSLIAKTLTRAGLSVLLLESGPGTAADFQGYTGHLETFYRSTGKGPESAWPPAIEVPQPDTGDLPTAAGNTSQYFVQKGPNLYGSSYTRTRGGSTLHWLGVSLRMLPEDFQLRTRHGVGRDWPIGYDDLEPYYRKAEYELGVSADVADQRYHGLDFPEDYDYPMRRVPLSYSDQKLAAGVDGMEVELEGEKYPLKIRSYPAARNSIPRYGYVPVGAADVRANGALVETYLGQRCAGNTSCTPICPIQAKYNAGKTLAQADWRKLNVLTEAVASRIDIDDESRVVQSITYTRYDGSTSKAIGRVYILAAHAVENARLMLISPGLCDKDSLVGKTLMDHPALYAWGLAPSPIGSYRGPLSTAGLEELRGGSFRSKHAAFRFDIGNDGWRASTGAPDTSVADAVNGQGLFGKKLRDELASTLSRHVRFSLAVEQLPDVANGVSIDPQYVDALGIPRPVIHYRIDDYTLAGMAAATKVYQQMFQRAGITDCTHPVNSPFFPPVQYGDTTFQYHGMGHFSGTHAMGADASCSVVDAKQRSWNHRNLFLVGSGSFATMGTSNPTLTLAALTINTAEYVIEQLKGGSL